VNSRCTGALDDKAVLYLKNSCLINLLVIKLWHISINKLYCWPVITRSKMHYVTLHYAVKCQFWLVKHIKKANTKYSA